MHIERARERAKCEVASPVGHWEERSSGVATVRIYSDDDPDIVLVKVVRERRGHCSLPPHVGCTKPQISSENLKGRDHLQA